MSDRRSERPVRVIKLQALDAWMERHPFLVMLVTCLCVWAIVVCLFLALVWSDG